MARITSLLRVSKLCWNIRLYDVVLDCIHLDGSIVSFIFSVQQDVNLRANVCEEAVNFSDRGETNESEGKNLWR